MKAYVLIQAAAEGTPLAHELRAIPGVISAEDLSGPFDAIALARSDSTMKLMEGILTQIQMLPGVIRALPAPLIRSLSEGLKPSVFSDRGDEAA